MTDIVAAAVNNQEEHPGHGEVTWVVTFVNNETRTGTIGMLGGPNYVLQKGDMTYFFDADKVAYMYPKK